ncbi:ESAT-6-like protein EsxB [Austwickia sp. TVS 96-490-7B]|uniref:WXG100 family type VII secretion target n=1 Tax=Austwickia sp. TVS 96-490-7B TaxID=2830843 RepID=UPI001C599CBD|nr:WXG100 family type VII secretion target [Austwickia sp. TVS 96-490-7B]MBW3086893.1 ESAT-6-like protein EsxB [Austwickia sp. TVS 96-490-7B]
MAGAGFGAELEAMQRAASQVEQINEGIQGKLQSLQAECQSASGHWKGQASASFQSLMVQWNTEAKNLNTALREIADQIRQSGKAYSAQEEASMQGMKAAGSGLNMG